ncbi:MULTISPECIES: hypothetical protein [Acinetobacter]|uniref:hypothetical protein n=1 Tax=Acinetobacter TaxID=469 RepID=UPI00200422F9|nr:MULTISPECIES: hypothetical protein [Acinetobacter]MCK4082146.1 hypothetical protein [Acinetobacter radioresistens]MDU4033827.1 hypothetical protein [Acinetobacter sp.]
MINFTTQELEDIYIFALEYGGDSGNAICSKIAEKYTFCHMCNSLIPNEHWQEHYEKEFEREYPSSL